MATFSRPAQRLLALPVTLGNVPHPVFGELRGRFRRKRERGAGGVWSAVSSGAGYPRPPAGGVSAEAGWEVEGLAVVGGGETVEQ